MTQTGLTDISSSNKPIPESLTTDSIEKKMAGNNPPASELPTSNPVNEVKKGATGQKQVDETPNAGELLDTSPTIFKVPFPVVVITHLPPCPLSLL